MQTERKITKVEGRAIPVVGNEIDTDRIIPARYLRCVTFDGLGDHAFEDDRRDPKHPFNDPRYQGAKILVSNQNFGCGSSREHAPQSLMRWGIAGFIAESFAEIFFGNCVTLGLPCLALSAPDVAALQAAIAADPSLQLEIDVAAQTVRAGACVYQGKIPAGPREQLLSGAWDALGELLDAKPAIQRLEESLPY